MMHKLIAPSILAASLLATAAQAASADWTLQLLRLVVGEEGGHR